MSVITTSVNIKGYTNLHVKHGLLYNWYITDTVKNVAPIGWHVPSRTEIDAFITWINAQGIYGQPGHPTWNGKALAKNSGWSASSNPGYVGYNQSTNDSTGWYGNQTGYRYDIFYAFASEGFYLTTTVMDPTHNYVYELASGLAALYPHTTLKGVGGAIRCLRDSNEGWVEGERVTDYDGNTYDTVKIGDFIWLKQNLAVTHYNDGTLIPEVTDNAEWPSLTTGALCAFNNDWSYVFY